MKQFWILGGAVLGACSLVACVGDDTTNAAPTGDAGAKLDASLPTDAAPPSDSGPLEDTGADASTITDAGDAGAPSGYALFVGTDFKKAELSVIALHPDSVAGRVQIADQDSVPYASGKAGFVIEHGLGLAVALDTVQPWKVDGTINLNDGPEAGAYSANARTVLVTTGTKAYVARYASNVIKIVDVATKAGVGTVDLSAFMGSDDTDGLVDVQDAVYDATSKRAYFLLQRINQFDFSGSAPDYVSQCLVARGAIVAVDVTNDSIVDLNGAAAGQAIELLGDNPAGLTPDFANGRIVVPETGCYELPDGGADAGPSTRVGRGIESVALATGAPTWLYQTTDLERTGGLIWIDGKHAYVNKGSAWFPWDPTQTTLGAAIADFPDAPLYDGAGRIVGVHAAAPDAGSDAGTTWSVVAWDIATSQLSTIATSPFKSVSPSTFTGGVSSALVH